LQLVVVVVVVVAVVVVAVVVVIVVVVLVLLEGFAGTSTRGRRLRVQLSWFGSL